MSHPVAGPEEFDIDCQLGLVGNDGERREAMSKIVAFYKRPLFDFLRAQLSFLSEDDVADAVQETFIALWRMVQKAELDIDRPLKSLLFTIARRRGIDLWRAGRRLLPIDDELVEAVAKALAATQLGAAWGTAQRQEEANAIMAEFREFVSGLPPKQRLVGGAMLAHLPETAKNEEIAAYIRQTSRMPVTSIEVKGARQALRKKFRYLMEKRGFL